MTGWQVWRAGPGDKATLAALEAHAFGERSWGANNVRESFVAPRVTVLMAGKSKSSPAGFVIWLDLDGEAEILSIGVDPDCRREGLARALLAAAIGEAKAAGAARMFLEVDAGNEAALALYRGAGFVEIARRRAYYRDGADATVMQYVF